MLRYMTKIVVFAIIAFLLCIGICLSAITQVVPRRKGDSRSSIPQVVRPQSVPTYSGTNPSPGAIHDKLVAAGQRYHIPPHILFGIAFQESSWRQFGSDGRTVMHPETDGRIGVGIMQITVYPTVSDFARLCTDIDYNIDHGAAMLIDKWNATPVIGDGVGNNGHEKLENWYYAIWAYNGFAAINNPNSNSNSYQHRVIGWIANCPNGQWQDCAITVPSNSSIGTGYPKPIPVTPSPYHVDANYDGIIDTANVSAKLFISESDAASNPGQEGFFRYGPTTWWHDVSGIGDGGHMFWTWNNAGHIDNYADWTPSIANSGNYEVFVFVPHANATTRNAHYTVHHADGQTERYINQYNYNDAWVSLGIYRFNAGTSGYLRLVDQTGERDTTQKVGFDAAQWMAR